MSFKLWLEVAELNKPSSSVRRKTIIKDKGTNVARPVVQFQWTTKLGNTIKLQMEPTDQARTSYFVIFYVNDVLYDFASKKEASARDYEILGNVFYVLKEKADKLNAQSLTFRAHKGERDDPRIVRGQDPNAQKPEIFGLIDRLKKNILRFEPEWAAPDEKKVALYQRIKKEVPATIQHKSIVILNNILKAVENNEEIDQLIYNFQVMHGTEDLLIKKLQDYNNAVKTNRPEGLSVPRNRRRNVYMKVLQRDFSQDWNIRTDGVNDEHFIMTRKRPVYMDPFESIIQP